jgi:hypothetical protein
VVSDKTRKLKLFLTMTLRGIKTKQKSKLQQTIKIQICFLSVSQLLGRIRQQRQQN